MRIDFPGQLLRSRLCGKRFCCRLSPAFNQSCDPVFRGGNTACPGLDIPLQAIAACHSLFSATCDVCQAATSLDFFSAGLGQHGAGVSKANFQRVFIIGLCGKRHHRQCLINHSQICLGA